MQIGSVDFHIPELESMKSYPKQLFYKGDVTLLQKPKVAIVGSRHPNSYAREVTHQIANALSKAGVVVVSGGAMGVDSVAHKAAKPCNTIMVAGTGLDKRYPAINKTLIAQIEQEGLVLSQFAVGTPSQKYNFPLRNELVVALGEALVVTYADANSGTMRSVEYALKMGKEVYVVPHRLGESTATNELVAKGLATPIYDIGDFVAKFAPSKQEVVTKSELQDPFLEFCASSPTYDEALKFDANKLFEYELLGKVSVVNGVVSLS